MATAWLPLVLLLPWLVPRWLDALRARDARVLLPLGFAVLYVAFFTLSRGKRDVYILSALPMVALPAGYLLPQLLRRRGVQWTLAGLAAFIGVVSAAAFVWLTFIDAKRGSALLAEAGVRDFAPLALIALAACAALAAFRGARAHVALAATFAAAWLVLGFWVFPQMDGARSARDFIARLEAMAAPDRELGLLAYHEHFLWHLRRPTVNFGHRRFREGDAETFDAAAWLAADPQRQLLVPVRMLKPCFEDTHRRVVGDSSRGDWYLVTGTPAASCVGRGNARHTFAYSPTASAVAR
jgi:hypothetical protein